MSPTGTPLFSVIIPTFERPAFLAGAVGSVLAQTVDDFECVVVDDAGSTPIELPSDPRIRVVRRRENGGDAASRNTGLDAARGRYVTFLDDDDLYTPHRLEIGLEALRTAPVGLCWRAGFDGEPRGNRVLNGNVHDVIFDDLTPQIGQVSVPRDRALRFDESYHGMTDIEWFLRLSAVAGFFTVPRVGMLYRMHTGPRARTGMDARIRGSLRILEVHAEYFARHRSALAFRWRRIGLTASKTGDRRLARAALRRSLRLAPGPKALGHFARTFAKNGAGVSA